MPDIAKRDLKDKVERVHKLVEDRSLPFRIAWVGVGVVVLLAGIAMTVFPGPAIVVVPLGLAMIAVEFAWACRLLDRGIDAGYAAAEVLERMDTYKKVSGAVALVAALAAVAALLLLR